MVDIWVDGSYRTDQRGVPLAGIGVYYGPGHKYNKSLALSERANVDELRPTSQRAELCAFLEALHHVYNDILDKQLWEPVHIHTDSKFVYDLVHRLGPKYEANNYIKANGRTVVDENEARSIMFFVESINDHLRTYRFPKLIVSLVEAHTGNVGNEAADQLAKDGAKKMSEMYRTGELKLSEMAWYRKQTRREKTKAKRQNKKVLERKRKRAEKGRIENFAKVLVLALFAYEIRWLAKELGWL